MELAQDDVVRIGPYRLVFRETTGGPPKHRPQTMPAFDIEAAEVDLNELQDRAQSAGAVDHANHAELPADARAGAAA